MSLKATKGGSYGGPPDGGGGIHSSLFGKFPKGFLLSCFAKKVSKEREKGENSRAHRNRVPAKPALWERGETANKAKLLAKSKNEQKGEA